MGGNFRVCSNCKGSPWLIKVIPGRGMTAYPCPFCNAEKPHRPPMEINEEEHKEFIKRGL